MKIIFKLFFLILLTCCSFDNKTGIWNEENNILIDKSNNIFKDFKNTSSSEKIFDETIPIKNNFDFKIPEPISNKKWNDIFYKTNNNLNNFKFSGYNQLVFKSKKLSKYLSGGDLLFENGNVIISDIKGNLIVFSVSENKIISEFNFYKKRFKRIKKKLNIIVEKNIIYVADNIGYIYAINFVDNKIIWAKDYKIPFSSNLKIFQDKIAVSSQNNNLNIINKNDGNLIKLIPTEETIINNQFINNLSTDGKKQIFFLNTFGSLYSIDFDSLRINWFNNFNQSTELLNSELFDGNKIVNNDEFLIISSNNKTYVIENQTGTIVKIFNFSVKVKPIIINELVFLITNNNYLITLDLKSNSILYSYNISNIDEIKKIIKREPIRDIMILNSKIYIFFNSRILNFSIDGIFQEIIKAPSKINSSLILINEKIIYLNKKNRLITLN